MGKNKNSQIKLVYGEHMKTGFNVLKVSVVLEAFADITKKCIVFMRCACNFLNYICYYFVPIAKNVANVEILQITKNIFIN